MNRKIEIVVAHEANLCFTALKALLDHHAEFEVVGSTDVVANVEILVQELRPDVLVCDLHLSGTQCGSTIRTVTSKYPDTRVVVLSMERTAQNVQAAIRAGGACYVLKDAPAGELFEAIRAAAAGRQFLGSGLPVKLFRDSQAEAEAEAKHLICDRLTMREHEVLALVADGRSSKEIAEALSLSAKTIAKHRANLMRKLDLHNVAALTRFAHEIGLFSGSRAPGATDDGLEVKREIRFR